MGQDCTHGVELGLSLPSVPTTLGLISILKALLGQTGELTSIIPYLSHSGTQQRTGFWLYRW